jgi:hypothetical protein
MLTRMLYVYGDAGSVKQEHHNRNRNKRQLIII